MKADAVHSRKYDYSKFVYRTAQSKSIIICPRHGEFLQIPNSHLSGSGCPTCKWETIKEKQQVLIMSKMSNLLERFKKVHGDRYDYSKVKYHRSTVKVEIGCPIHGFFMQRAHGHIHGKGCPICAESKGERAVRVALEEMGIRFEQQKRFPDCKKVKPLAFDFWLPDHNTVIEFDGVQHREPRNFRSLAKVSNWDPDSLTAFQDTQERDEIKNAWCKSNGIHLIRVTDASTSRELVANLPTILQLSPHPQGYITWPNRLLRNLPPSVT